MESTSEAQGMAHVEVRFPSASHLATTWKVEKGDVQKARGRPPDTAFQQQRNVREETASETSTRDAWHGSATPASFPELWNGRQQHANMTQKGIVLSFNWLTWTALPAEQDACAEAGCPPSDSSSLQACRPWMAGKMPAENMHLTSIGAPANARCDAQAS